MKIFTAFKLISLLFLAGFLMNCLQSKNLAAVEKKSNPQYYTMADFTSVEKYDAHVHVDTDKDTFLKQAEEDNFRLLTIN